MKVPSRFKALGYTIKVIRPTKEKLDRLAGGDCAGFFDPTKMRIAVGKELSEDMALHTWLHEVTHLAFHLMGEDELYVNEKLVDLLAAIMHQALVSAEYDPPKESTPTL